MIRLIGVDAHRASFPRNKNQSGHPLCVSVEGQYLYSHQDFQPTISARCYSVNSKEGDAQSQLTFFYINVYLNYSEKPSNYGAALRASGPLPYGACSWQTVSLLQNPFLRITSNNLETSGT